MKMKENTLYPRVEIKKNKVRFSGDKALYKR